MKVEKIVKGQYITESNKKSLEDCQKWVDYDLKRYGKISDTTMKFIVDAGFVVGKDENGDFEVVKFTKTENKNLKEAFENTSPDDMNYKMDIVIFNPENTDVEKTYQLDAKFSYDKNTYGTGYGVFIKGENGFDTVYDLRYDIDFNPKDKMKWLIDWANRYWSGRNGAYKLKKISIEKDMTEDLFKKPIKEAYFNRGAHKIIVDKYWAKDNIDVEDFVYVILPRQKVFSRITRQDLFDNKLHYGTFIDNIPLDGAQKEVDDYAKEIINELGAKEVSIEELKNIENETKDQDVAQAFAHAEKSFAN